MFSSEITFLFLFQGDPPCSPHGMVPCPYGDGSAASYPWSSGEMEEPTRAMLALRTEHALRQAVHEVEHNAITMEQIIKERWKHKGLAFSHLLT